MNSAILKGYAQAAADLIPAFEAISSRALFTPVEPYLPRAPCRVLDIGAGTGRDAAWFAAQGHSNLAVEPVDAFRQAGALRHNSHNIACLSDTLPHLPKTVFRAETFDLILLSAVWQHLDDTARQLALATLRKLASPNARIIISVRHGPGAPSRQTYPARPTDVQTWARQHGFAQIHEGPADSAQPQNRLAGVSWTWIVLQAPASFSDWQ